MNIPAIPLQNGKDGDFYRALMKASEGHIPVLVFHGVPDTVHPWVDTPPEKFAQYMKYLHDNNYKVVALRDV